MKVLVGNPWINRHIDKLEATFPDLEFLKGDNFDDIVAQAPHAEVALGPISRDAFVAGTNLKWIQSFSAGVEWFRDSDQHGNGAVILYSPAS